MGSHEPRIAPSILAADFGRLGEELAAIEAAYLSAKTGAPESPQQFIND